MTCISCFHIWYFDIPSSWSCIKATSPEAEMDCIRSFCHSLFLLVVDLPNGSDFPKPVGNTAIQYFLSMRHSRIVLSYSSTHRCQIVVKYLSKRCQSYRMEAAMFFFTQHRRHWESGSLIGCSARLILFLIG